MYEWGKEMSTQYHFDNKVYTDKAEWKKEIAKDWYKQYNKYMIQEFFFVGRKIVYEGIEYEVLDNDVRISNTIGWLRVKSTSEDSYVAYLHPRTILFKHPNLKTLLDQNFKRENSGIETLEHYEQIVLF